VKPKTKEKLSSVLLTSYFVVFVIFLYLPMITMFILSFHGKHGGMTLPINDVSLYWWKNIFQDDRIISAFQRSLVLAFVIMIINAVFSLMLGMAFRKRFKGSGAVFYTIIVGLMTPGILVSLGLISIVRLIDVQAHWYSTGLGVHLIWTLPFGFLIMMAVFNRFNKNLEDAAADLGASPWQVFKEVTLPIISVGILAAALFGFTLSYDEFARTLLVSGSYNTLPLEIHSRMSTTLKPVVYVLGTASTLVSLIIIGVFLFVTKKIANRTLKKQK
jgi:putative spermidine/putrescine transport system permease protein